MNKLIFILISILILFIPENSRTYALEQPLNTYSANMCWARLESTDNSIDFKYTNDIDFNDSFLYLDKLLSNIDYEMIDQNYQKSNTYLIFYKSY